MSGKILRVCALSFLLLPWVQGCAKPVPGMTDDQLAANVRERIVSHPMSAIIPVMVEARGGVVYLTGAVYRPRDSEMVEQVARGARGVTSIRNQLEILDPVDDNQDK